MRKRLSISVVALAAVAMMIPAPSASASSCVPQDLDDVFCVIYGTPYWKLCVALGVCQPPA